MKLTWWNKRIKLNVSGGIRKRCLKYAAAAAALAVWGGGLAACSSVQETGGTADRAAVRSVRQTDRADALRQDESCEGQLAQNDGSYHKKHKKKRYNKHKKNYAASDGGSEQGQGLVDLGRLAPPQQGTVRLASWNMHDLFDTIDDPNHDVVLSRQEYADKLSILANVLSRIHADAVGVQEVENQGCLKDLAARAGYPYYLLVEGNDSMRGIDVGVLSKIPIRNYVTHSRDKCFAGSGGRPYYFSRDCLEVHFNHPSRLVMLVNHFKSKRGDSDDSTVSQRMAQAGRVRSIASGLRKYPVIIVGDFNDEPNSQALSPLTRTAGLHDVLSWMGSSRVSFKSRHFSSALDYLVLNDMLADRMVDRSARIVVGKEVSAASDHRPVIVDVRL